MVNFSQTMVSIFLLFYCSFYNEVDFYLVVLAGSYKLSQLTSYVCSLAVKLNNCWTYIATHYITRLSTVTELIISQLPLYLVAISWKSVGYLQIAMCLQ